MLSPDGHPVGVFAVFSKEPRATFNLDQRRDLAHYSTIAMKEISQLADLYLDSDLQSLRSTPLLQRDSDYRPIKEKSPSIDTDHTMVPSGLRYHKVKTPPTDTTRVFLNRHMSSDITSEQTPPSSSEGSENDTFPGSPKGFDKNYKQLSVNSNLNHISSSYGDLITPDSEGFRVPTPRPFSDSDLTSLNPHPPNTPVHLSHDASLHNDFDLTVENFMSLSDIDCAEQESPLIDLNTPQDLDKSQPGENQSLPQSPTSRLTFDSISTALTNHSRNRNEVKEAARNEAAFFCAEIAEKLRYDVLYVVEIRPSRPNMTDEEIFSSNGLYREILTGKGLEIRRLRASDIRPEEPVLSLRTRPTEEIRHETPDAKSETEDCRSAIWLPIHTEGGPRSQRTSGIVFGAFRLPKPVEDGVATQDISDDEIRELKDAVVALKRIFRKYWKLQNGHRSPSNSAASSPRRDAANESVKEGRHLLDLTPQPFSVSEAVGVGRDFSTHNQCALDEGFPAGEATEIGQVLRDLSPNQVNEAVQVVSTSFTSTKAHAEPPEPPAKSNRLTKSSKSSRRSSKAKSVEAQEISLDAGLERPFHAIARFRAF
jgi:hypothetical protein